MNSSRAIIFCCLVLMLYIEDVAADRQVVLVTASMSPLKNLGSLELRKIFLGFSVWRDGNIVKGLRNIEDENLNSIFLQNIVAMSAKSYEYRLLSLTIRQGTPRPAEYDKLKDLLNALSSNSYSVSFMWKNDAVLLSKIKILRVLWHQN